MFTENVFTLLQTEGTFRKVQLMELQRYTPKVSFRKEKKNIHYFKAVTDLQLH